MSDPAGYLAAWIHDVFAVRNILAPFVYPAALFFSVDAMRLTEANRLVALRRWFQNPLKLERWRNEGQLTANRALKPTVPESPTK